MEFTKKFSDIWVNNAQIVPHPNLPPVGEGASHIPSPTRGGSGRGATDDQN